MYVFLYSVNNIINVSKKFKFVFSLNYILSNHIYILSNHIYILSNRFYIVSNRINIGLKSLSNVFNTEQYFFQTFVLSQKFPLCTALHPGTTLNCDWCNQRVPSTLVSGPGGSYSPEPFCPHYCLSGDLMLVQVDRPLGSTTPILEPGLEEVWGGRRLVAVITHIGQGSASQGGHCGGYILDGEVWWKLESLGDRIPVVENPFLTAYCIFINCIKKN